ncbi:MAG: ferredoxin family protein, partial [Rubripirellula sp.]
MISAVQDATCTVVISRGQSRNPQKRGLEQGIADEIAKLKGVNVLTIPHLYDLPKTSDSYQQLSQIEGNLIVVSWIYSRAAHWILDRNGIQGQVGHVEIGNADDDDSEQE